MAKCQHGAAGRCSQAHQWGKSWDKIHTLCRLNPSKRDLICAWAELPNSVHPQVYSWDWKYLSLWGKKKNHPWQPQSCGEDTGATQDPCIREKSKEATTQFSCDTPHEQSATGPNNPATGTMSWIPSVCTKFCINILPVLSSSKFLSHREFSQQAYF